MNNQKKYWDDLHQKGLMQNYALEPTDFAKEVIELFPTKANVLDLGCGLGNDSLFFTKSSLKVTATDFSEAVIKQNIGNNKMQGNLLFRVVDMNQKLPFDNLEFDVVYARLSLHYFTDKITKQLFSEICRVLKSGGLFCFICKSIEDSLYGKGRKIEKDMYDLDKHIRHFFSINYTKECLGDNYHLRQINSGHENFYGQKSGFIKVIAEKI
jgi:ubiquinone/menaquinone biosynthesis C-methylase UbiE